MTQHMKLGLNPEVLLALFPTGSEARIELRTAVIAAFVKAHVRDHALGEDVQKQIQAARADAIIAVQKAKQEAFQKALTELGATKDSWGTIKLSDNLKAEVAEQARKAVRNQISSDVAEQVKVLSENLKTTMVHDAQVAVNRLVDAEIRALVKAKITAAMASL